MPSATKGAASSVETNDSMQVVMSVVEKKARNLEKKRVREIDEHMASFIDVMGIALRL